MRQRVGFLKEIKKINKRLAVTKKGEKTKLTKLRWKRSIIMIMTLRKCKEL